jgi:hypothetical protein
MLRFSDNKAVHPSLLPCGTLVAKRLAQETALTHPAVALALFVATATVPVAVPSVTAGASFVLESTERVAEEVAEPL